MIVQKETILQSRVLVEKPLKREN